MTIKNKGEINMNHNAQEINPGFESRILLFNIDPLLTHSLGIDFLHAGIDVFDTHSREEALKILKMVPVHIVLADYGSKRNETLAFLHTMRDKYPMIHRALLCDENEQRQVMHLLVKGAVNSYFEKPGGIGILAESIGHAMNTREILGNPKLLNVINSIRQLPTFPNTYRQFAEAVEADRSPKDIAGILKKDVAVAVKVLQIANSAFHTTTKFASVERACIYLGLETVKIIAVTSYLGDTGKMSRKRALHLQRIVAHLVRVNQNFQKVYKYETRKNTPSHYSSVGLTHDIGKMILLQYLPDRYKRIVRYREKNPGIDFYRSEVELGYEGSTHAEIGAYFLALWNFPEENIITALFHHTPEMAAGRQKELLDIFSFANDLGRRN